VQRLIRSGQMRPSGLRLVETAQRSGEWYKTREREPIDVIPDDLAVALEADGRARAFFETLAPSYRRMYLAWLAAARRPETRARRIRVVVERSAAGKKPGIDL
jgi:uncharacterized protein YdeI (YjbR/CyaY-like superfamily)